MKNQNTSRSQNGKNKGKNQNQEKEKTFLTEPQNKNKTAHDNTQSIQIKEQIQKQAMLLKRIQDAEEKLKFTQEQRKKLISTKKLEIEKKDQTINQMRLTNEQLQKELDILQTQVQDSLDNVEYKEKNELFEEEKKKREDPLKEIIEQKQQELNEIVQKGKVIKKEKEKLQGYLEEKVNLEQINSLNSEIKLTQEKIDELEKEKEYLLKLKEDHDECEVQNKKIREEIEEIKENLEKIREQNKLKSKMEQKKQSLKMKEINHNLTAKQIKDRNEQLIKNEIDKYWEKNKNLLNASYSEEKVNIKRQSNAKRKIHNYSTEVLNKNMELSNISMNNDENKLPKIPLFKQNEKKVLLGILPEKELNKYEKRYEIV